MKKIIIFLLVVFATIFLAIAFFIINQPSKQLTDAEKEKALVDLLGRKVNTGDKDVPKGDTEYRGKLYSFSYPKSATVAQRLFNGTPVPETGLESFIIQMNSPKMSLFTQAIEVPITVQNLEDYPGVRLRETQSNLYEKSKVTAGEVRGLVFVKDDLSGYEKTAFFYLKSVVYSFSFQGSDSKAVNELFLKVMGSLKFSEF